MGKELRFHIKSEALQELYTRIYAWDVEETSFKMEYCKQLAVSKTRKHTCGAFVLALPSGVEIEEGRAGDHRESWRSW